MVKISTQRLLVSLDDLDLKILSILMEDSRISLNKIAERLGVSVSTVSARVKKLESEGIIGKYTIYIDCRRLGFENIVFLLIKASRDTDEVVRDLAEIPNIKAIYRIAGAYDFLVQGIALDIESLEELIRKVKRIEGVLEVNTFIVLRTEKEAYYPDPSCIARAIEFSLRKK